MNYKLAQDVELGDVLSGGMSTGYKVVRITTHISPNGGIEYIFKCDSGHTFYNYHDDKMILKS